MQYTITKNAEYGSLEIKFDGKPSEAVRDALKSMRFKWHSLKKIWYGFADEQTARNAIEGNRAEPAQTAAKPAQKATKGTPQTHIKIYWNGIKIDGGKMVRCFYSINNNAQIKGDCVSISARDYDSLPADLLPVTNDTDIYTDYFDNDRATLTPEHPLYKYFRYAAEKARARYDRPYCEKLREELSGGKRERWPGHFDGLRKDLASREAFLALFDAATDPGQPTAEDLAAIDRQRQEAENARKAAEHERECREREKYLCKKANGNHLIMEEQAAHPVEENRPTVTINWSEHPAFYDFQDDSLKLSVPAAENILRKLDEEEYKERHTEQESGGYYKTKFTITGVDDSGEEYSYTGRYDLGDGDGGLVAHIRSTGEWYRTHDDFGKIKPAPDVTNGIILLADFLAGLCCNEGSEQPCFISLL